MQWYYAEGSDKRGPLTEAQIRPLITSGIISATTLVWTTGMTAWKPAGETALFSASPGDAVDVSQQRCLITGKRYPASQMIKTQHGWVSAEGKDRYYQSLRENVTLFAEGVPNARRAGNCIVVPVQGAQLPARCVKTNLPVSPDQIKARTLYWCSPWILLSILLNLIICLILYLVFRKKVTVPVPLSREGLGIVRKHAMIAWMIGLAGVSLVIFAIVNADELIALILPGVLLVLAAIIYGNIKATTLRVSKIKDGHAWLAGASPSFLATLPPF